MVMNHDHRLKIVKKNIWGLIESGWTIDPGTSASMGVDGSGSHYPPPLSRKLNLTFKSDVLVILLKTGKIVSSHTHSIRFIIRSNVILDIFTSLLRNIQAYAAVMGVSQEQEVSKTF